MKELQLLENQLLEMLDNIQRIKEFREENKKSNYKPFNSHVVGELKHRFIILKRKMTTISKINTYDLLK